MAPSILDLTDNLIDQYLWTCGKSEVPRDYHLWSCIALIAACLSDRVWMQKFNHARLAPNLYVMLLGPSGLGKGEAIDAMMRYASTLEELKALHLFAGDITAQGLLDHLSRRDVSGRLFVVQEELGMSVPEGPLGRDFIKHLTGLYKTSSYKWRKRTAGGGLTEIGEHCLNAIFGTNKRWLVESVPRSSIEGGFLARVPCVEADYSDERLWTPVYPDDVEEIRLHVAERFMALTQLSGEFVLNGEAGDILRHWYETRPKPADEMLLPTWRREDDLVRKLTMILQVAEAPVLVGQPKAVIRAQQLAARILATVPSVISLASETPDTADLERVARAIKRSGRIQHSVLLRTLSPMSGKKLNEFIDTLRQRKQITFEDSATTGRTYAWRRRTVPKFEAHEAPPESGEHTNEEDT